MSLLPPAGWEAVFRHHTPFVAEQETLSVSCVFLPAVIPVTVSLSDRGMWNLATMCIGPLGF